MPISRKNGSPPPLNDDSEQPISRNSAAPDPAPQRERDELSRDDSTAATNRARQGVTGHNVRYVLVLSLAGVVLAFILIYAAFFS